MDTEISDNINGAAEAIVQGLERINRTGSQIYVKSITYKFILDVYADTTAFNEVPYIRMITYECREERERPIIGQ